MKRLGWQHRWLLIGLLCGGLYLYNPAHSASADDKVITEPTIPADYRQLDSLLQQVNRELDAKQLEKARQTNQLALDLAEKLQDKPAMLEARLNFSNIYSLSGNAPAVITNNLAALPIAKQLRDRRAKAELLLDLGGAYGELGNNKKGMEYYFGALRLFQAMHDMSGIAGALNNISVSYDNMGNQEKSHEYLLKSLEVSRKVDDKEGIALALANLGQEARLRKDFLAAREYLKEALGILQQLPNPSAGLRTFIYLETARIHFDQGRYSKAVTSLKQAQRLSQTHGFDKQLFHCLELAVKIHLRQQHFALASEVLDQAMELTDKYGMALEKTILFKLRSQIQAKQGNYQAALSNLNIYVERTLKEMKEENDRQTLAFQALSDAKEKQREIKSLKQQQAQQALQLKQQQETQSLLIIGMLGIGVLLLILLALIYALRRSKRIISRQNEALSAAIANAEHMARRDALTHLLNRRGFLELMEYELEQQKRHDRPVSIVIADIDHFKKLNDTHGHECGDKVLSQVAKHLEKSTRKQDSLCRWGGEEFIIMMPNTGSAQAKILIERLRRGLGNKHLMCNGHLINLTMTFGIVVCEKGETVDQCIARADSALYEGKATGRNKSVFVPHPDA